MKNRQEDSSPVDDAARPLKRIDRGFAALTGIDKDVAKQLSIASPAPDFRGKPGRSAGFIWAVVACLLTTVLALPFRGLLDPTNVVVLYLLAVVLVAVRFGRGPGIFASVLAVLIFDFFLVRPYQSLTVADTQYLLTFGVMLTVALIISSLAANLREQARIAYYRERRTNALFDLSKALSAALTVEQIIDVATHHVEAMFQASAALLLPDEHGKLQPSAAGKNARPFVSPVALHSAQAVFDSPLTSSPDSTVKTSGRVLYLPLHAPTCIRGVLAVISGDTRRLLLPEQQRLLQTCAAQIALALERVHYVDVAKDALVSVESERLRNSLLSAISHDVRTPLTAIVGLSSTLVTQRSLSQDMREELIGAIQEEALRMSNLVTNLLDMGKLQAGGVRLNRQWQMLEEVVGSALGQLSRSLNGRGVDLALPPGLPLLNFDAVLIERVLCNILDNAVRYSTPATPIRIAALLNGDEIQVSVEDRGAGVPAGSEEAIFAKFVRGNPESAHAGAGLGLSICRAIIHAHGGRIRVDNPHGTGARFVFTLPLGSPPDYEECSESIELNRTDSAA
ncbi:MAG: osmosensitive channel His kinase sensor [Burkholderia sp.]|nr:osmosensitive channel His kinase sensor [Burkholderia sp.]